MGGSFLNIRNALLLDGSIHAKVGVGVLKESVAQSELAETRDKVSGVLEAIQLWEHSRTSQAGNVCPTRRNLGGCAQRSSDEWVAPEVRRVLLVLVNELETSNSKGGE